MTQMISIDQYEQAESGFFGKSLLSRGDYLKRANELSREGAPIDGASTLLLRGVHLWTHNQRPRITLGHKLLSSFCVSRYDNIFASLKLPFTSLVIQIPEKCIWMSGLSGLCSVRRIIIYKDTINTDKPSWCITIDGEDNTTIWNNQRSMGELLHRAKAAPDKGLFNLEVTELDERAHVLCVRVIAGTLLSYEMGEWEYTAKQKKPKKGKNVKHRGIMRLTQKPSTDFREVVSNFSREGTKLDKRHVVIGHFKHQRFGKALSQTKLIWVQPYIRGPE